MKPALIRSVLVPVVGAMVGHELDRADGEGGLAGAALGWAAAILLPRMGTFGLIAGGAFVAARVYGRHRAARRLPAADA